MGFLVSQALYHYQVESLHKYFFLPHALVRQAFVGTLSVLFLRHQHCEVSFYFEAGIFSENTIEVSLWLILIIPIGVFLGKWLNNHLSDQIFYDISHLGLLAMGIKLILIVY